MGVLNQWEEGVVLIQGEEGVWVLSKGEEMAVLHPWVEEMAVLHPWGDGRVVHPWGEGRGEGVLTEGLGGTSEAGGLGDHRGVEGSNGEGGGQGPGAGNIGTTCLQLYVTFHSSLPHCQSVIVTGIIIHVNAVCVSVPQAHSRPMHLQASHRCHNRLVCTFAGLVGHTYCKF